MTKLDHHQIIKISNLSSQETLVNLYALLMFVNLYLLLILANLYSLLALVKFVQPVDDRSVNSNKSLYLINFSKSVLPIDVCRFESPMNSNEPVNPVDICKPVTS